MGVLRTATAELLGLFVEDGTLAIGTVLLIAVATGLVELAHLDPLVGAALLLLGSIATLLWSVHGAARARAPERQDDRDGPSAA